MNITIIQDDVKLSRFNLTQSIEIINKHKDNSDVIVFSELSLNGYMLQDKVYEDAYEIDELGEICSLSSSCDIIVGAVIKENAKTYNSSLYFSKGKLSHIHNKIHLPNYGMFEEARYFFKGENITPFMTQYGKAVMVICEDLWRAQTVAKLSDIKPDLIYVLAASPARDFSDKGVLIQDQWMSLLKSTALLCSSYVIFVNRVGFEDGLGFWGGSSIITPQSTIEYQLNNFETEHKNCELHHNLHVVQKWISKIG